ncbi:MAG TPA: HAD family hydrolase [Solirubrobacter sp.]|nr:HAD family hydrolase [Solirubrobacter sp.]
MWVLFDLNGTLVDPSGLVDDAPEIGVTALDEANMMAMVTALAGASAEFKPLLEAALRRGLERAGRDPSLVTEAVSRLPSMPAYPEVPDALSALRSGGVQLAVLTQSSADAAETVLANAGLRDHFELVLSAPDSGAFKPEDLAYRYGLEQCNATEAWFVAGHWWDIAGAAFAGLRTAWISRTDRAYPTAMPPPDVHGADLSEVATALLSKPKADSPL